MLHNKDQCNIIINNVKKEQVIKLGQKGKK